MTVAEQSIEIARLLVVSRESTLLAPLWSVSESNAWQIETATSAWDAIERIQSGDAPHLLVIDVPRGGEEDSHHVLRSLRRIDPNLPAIVVCFPEDADRNEDAIRLGAQEVLIKPLHDNQLESVIRRCLVSPGTGNGEVTGEDIEQLGSFFVSASPVSQKLRTQVQVLAQAEVPVLIVGETGSGKDTVARLIHQLSIRSGFEFQKINCADTPAELLEAELFGTASRTNGRSGNGQLDRASNGTIFFDEITELPLSVQSKLMQVLQNNSLVKPGMSKGVAIDFRLLAASSDNIDRAVTGGRLRDDLYCKLSAFTISVPPLRQRREEIVVLMQHLMHRLSRQYGLPARTFSPAAVNACRNYSWPGNLRELEAFVKRYLVIGDKGLSPSGVRSDLTRVHESRVSLAPEHAIEVTRKRDLNPDEVIEPDQTKPKSLKSIIHSVKSEAEKNAIEIALHKTGWNRKAAARLLQVSYRALLYKIDQYHLNAPQPYLGGFSYNGANSGGKEFKKN